MLQARNVTPLRLGALHLVAHAHQLANAAHAPRVAPDDGQDGEVVAVQRQEVALA